MRYYLTCAEHNQASRDAGAAAEAERKAKADADKAACEETSGEAYAAQEPKSALVVYKAHGTSWDRIGAVIRDMPFPSSVIENPLFDQVFGESEIAAPIREIKASDHSFQWEEFAEDVEYIVAPHTTKHT